jgi:hypothetical protein
MVAEGASRRKGIAAEALILMMCYGIRFLKVHSFVAKVLEKNEPSLKLFLKLGFSETKRVPGTDSALLAAAGLQADQCSVGLLQHVMQLHVMRSQCASKHLRGRPPSRPQHTVRTQTNYVEHGSKGNAANGRQPAATG